MNYCENRNIINNKEMFVCTNCCVIHGYFWNNENIYNLLKCKTSFYKRKKYLNKKFNLDNRIILFLDESFGNVRKYLKLKRFPISKYLNTIYQYYCNKANIDYQSLNSSKIMKLDDNIIQILNRGYLKYPHIFIKRVINKSLQCHLKLKNKSGPLNLINF